VGTTIWSRTKEKLAVQETLRRLVDSGSALTPDVIDALRRPQPKRPPEETRARVIKYRYWGWFLLGLAAAITLWQIPYTSPPVTGLVFFGIPGLFCLAHSLITSRSQTR